MKNLKLFFGIAAMSAVLTISCGPQLVEVSDLKLDKTTLELIAGKTYTFTATVLPDNATDKTVVWTSSDDNLASVENGIVTAKSNGTATITATAGTKINTCEVKVEGVLINGIGWATCNVSTIGNFADVPGSGGAFFQWNRKRAWSDGSNSAAWDSSYPDGDTWDKANDPCPDGWRVPTIGELKKLDEAENVTSEWTAQNGTNGRKFTDNVTHNSVFLPAPGYLHGNTSTKMNSTFYGYYWSSSVVNAGENEAYNLLVYSSKVDSEEIHFKNYGLSVRCVAK